MATTRTTQPAAAVPAEPPAAATSETAMPQRPDWTAQTVEYSTALSGQISALNAAVESHKARTTAVDLYATPLRAYVRNAAMGERWDASYKAASVANSAEDGWAQVLAELDQNIRYAVDKLAPVALNVDLVNGDGLEKKLAKILDNADMFIVVSDDAQTAAGLAVTAWNKAKADYRAATGNKAPASVKTDATPKAPSRGLGELVRTRGFQLVMECNDATCPQHTDPLRSGSNKGSAQDAMANHYVTRHNEERPRANDPEHTAFTAAMNAVLAEDAPESIEEPGGRFTIRREYVTAA